MASLKKGSVTLWLSLLLLVLLPAAAAILYSARMAACRAALASGAEQGLYSLFAQYDRDLYERFGLLFIDGGYGSAELRLGILLEETEEDILPVIRPADFGASGSDLLHMDLTGGSVTGYLLATDGDAAAFRRQICGAVLSAGGSGGLLFSAESARAEADQLLGLRAGFSASDEAPADGALLPEIPAGFVNPLDIIDSLRGQDLLTLAVPDPQAVSTAALAAQETVSRRALNRGMGMPVQYGGDAQEQSLLLAYLMEEFSCFTDQSPGEGLQYQIEYAAGGQLSDRENLQIILHRLFDIREAANMAYLMASPARCEEASDAALIIAAVFQQPELRPVFAFALKEAWAYGESLLDLRTLLGGGCVPLIKDDASWQLPLHSLASIGTAAPYGSGSREGLSYREYLQILLLDESSASLTAALLDLTEHVMRTERARTAFRLDNALEAVELAFEAQAGRQSWRIVRRYAYDPEIL